MLAACRSIESLSCRKLRLILRAFTLMLVRMCGSIREVAMRTVSLSAIVLLIFVPAAVCAKKQGQVRPYRTICTSEGCTVSIPISRGPSKITDDGRGVEQTWCTIPTASGTSDIELRRGQTLVTKMRRICIVWRDIDARGDFEKRVLGWTTNIEQILNVEQGSAPGFPARPRDITINQEFFQKNHPESRYELIDDVVYRMRKCGPDNYPANGKKDFLFNHPRILANSANVGYLHFIYRYSKLCS